jgi:hypothetical protein
VTVRPHPPPTKVGEPVGAVLRPCARPAARVPQIRSADEFGCRRSMDRAHQTSGTWPTDRAHQVLGSWASPACAFEKGLWDAYAYALERATECGPKLHFFRWACEWIVL